MGDGSGGCGRSRGASRGLERGREYALAFGARGANGRRLLEGARAPKGGKSAPCRSTTLCMEGEVESITYVVLRVGHQELGLHHGGNSGRLLLMLDELLGVPQHAILERQLGRISRGDPIVPFSSISTPPHRLEARAPNSKLTKCPSTCARDHPPLQPIEYPQTCPSWPTSSSLLAQPRGRKWGTRRGRGRKPRRRWCRSV